MLADARKRLEGRLEHVEHVSSLLELGAAEARRSADFRLLGSSLELDANDTTCTAEAGVKHMAAVEPELNPFIERLDAARWQAAELVVQRAHALHLPSMPLSRAAHTLAEDPVRFDARLFCLWPFVPLAVVGLMATLALHLWLVACGVIGLAIGAVLAASMRVVVTQQRFVVAGRCFQLAQVKKIDLAWDSGSPRLAVRAKVTLKDGREVQVWLPTVNDRLVESLEASQVKVDGSWSLFR